MYIGRMRTLVRFPLTLLALAAQTKYELSHYAWTAEETAETRAMADAGPAVESHRLVLELRPWFAAKGIKVVQ